MPVAEQVRADRRVPIPALVGILGPIEDPRRVIRKIGPQVQRMKPREDADQNQPSP